MEFIKIKYCIYTLSSHTLNLQCIILFYIIQYTIFAFRNRTQVTKPCETVQSCEDLIQGTYVVIKI